MLQQLVDSVRRLRLERVGELRPRYPEVALEMDRGQAVLVRLRRRRGGHTRLASHAESPLPDGAAGGAMLRPSLAAPEEVARRLARLFELAGTRPGRLILVVPDNLARVSLLSLPERPASRKHLLEILRFKLRRTVPFRLEEAVLAHQVLPSDGRGATVLAALALRSAIEPYEAAVEAAGGRPGLVELCSMSLFNLCRRDLARLGEGERDAALLNYTPTYFTLLLTRGARLLFYRCKSLALTDHEAGSGGVVARELATSLSYYKEKLGGQGLEAVLVRSVARPIADLQEILGRLGIERVVPVDPAAAVSSGDSSERLDPDVAQRIAPSVGAVVGRHL